MKDTEDTIATGRRKTSVASVRVRTGGSGKIDINGRTFEDYFPQEIQRQTALTAFQKIGGLKHHDLIIRVKGGGIEGQVGAVRLGIARALVKDNGDLKGDFKHQGLLTRDSRKKERKKYGQPGARKRFQFSKR